MEVPELFRTDHKADAGGAFVAVSALKLPNHHPVWDEYMLTMCDLDSVPSDQVVRHIDHATHEFLLFAVDPATPIDMRKSLFDQPHLSPLQPPNMGFQFQADSNEAALSKLKSCVSLLLSGALSPEEMTDDAWKAQFPGGFPLLMRLQD